MNILLISICGVSGVLIRYFADCFWETKNHIFPFATLVVNLLGCFIAGYFYVLLSKKLLFSEQTTRAVIIGLCGGLTTFSGYCLQILNLIQAGDYLKSFAFLILSIAFGLSMIILGMKSATYLS